MTWATTSRCPAFQRSSDHQTQSSLGDADGTHAVVDAARPQPSLGNGEPATLLSEQVVGGYPHVPIDNLRMPTSLGVAEDSWLHPDRHPRGVLGNCDHGMPVVCICIGIGRPHHNQDLAALGRGTAAEPLAAVEHIVPAVAAHRQRHIAGIGRGYIGSVMEKALRISPARSGASHRYFTVDDP